MSENEFRVVVRTDGASVVLDLGGTLDREAQGRFEAAFGEALARADGPVVLNFSDIGFINSTGIALVVGALAKGRAAKRQVRAFGLDAHYRHIFEITRLSDFIGIYDDESAALNPQEEQHA